MESRALTLIVAAFLLPALAAGQGQVWVVAPGTGHPQIQAVVDAAQDGDTVLVKQGSYQSFFIDDKALHVVAEAGAIVTVQTPVHVESLAFGKVVTLAGLRLQSQIPTAAAALVVRNNAGALRVVDCRIEGSHAGFFGHAQPGVRLLQSGDVAFVRCNLFGGRGDFDSQPGAQALFSRRANVAVYDGLVIGGQGGNAFFAGGDGGAGAPGYESPEGLLFAGNTNFNGGAGGIGGDEECFVLDPKQPGRGGDGGHGLLIGSISGLVSQAFLLGGLQAGGAGGKGGYGVFCFPPAPSGVSGQPFLVYFNSTVNTLNDPVRMLQSPRLAREQTQAPFSLVGVPGDTVYLMVSTTTQWVHEPTLAGVALVPSQFNARGRFAGIVPASGTLTFNLKLGDLGPGVQSRTLHLQALVYDSFGVPSLASFGVLAVVDQQF